MKISMFIVSAKQLTAGLMLTATLFLLVACNGESAPEGETTLERIQRTGKVTIGYAPEEPFGYLDVRSGRVTGEAPEIARVILERMGVKEIETRQVDFGSLIPGLQAGQFDIVGAGMYITPERCEQVDFSNPTYQVGEGFIVHEGNPKGLHSFEDVAEKPDVMLGVVNGTVEIRFAKRAGVPEDRLVYYPNNPTALSAVRTGKVDAFACTALTAKTLLAKVPEGELELAAPFEQPGGAVNYGAFAFRPSDDTLREAFNEQLADFIGTQEHLDLVEPFGFGPNQLPGDVTAEQICSGQLPATPEAEPEQPAQVEDETGPLSEPAQTPDDAALPME